MIGCRMNRIVRKKSKMLRIMILKKIEKGINGKKIYIELRMRILIVDKRENIKEVGKEDMKMVGKRMKSKKGREWWKWRKKKKGKDWKRKVEEIEKNGDGIEIER